MNNGELVEEFIKYIDNKQADKIVITFPLNVFLQRNLLIAACSVLSHPKNAQLLVGSSDLVQVFPSLLNEWKKLVELQIGTLKEVLNSNPYEGHSAAGLSYEDLRYVPNVFEVLAEIV